jgi:hypothetical protein
MNLKERLQKCSALIMKFKLEMNEARAKGDMQKAYDAKWKMETAEGVFKNMQRQLERSKV